MSDKDYTEPITNPCGGYYCDERIGHIDCRDGDEAWRLALRRRFLALIGKGQGGAQQGAGEPDKVETGQTAAEAGESAEGQEERFMNTPGNRAGELTEMIMMRIAGVLNPDAILKDLDTSTYNKIYSAVYAVLERRVK